MPDQLMSLSATLGDRYRVERELGRGSMATVYLAEDPRHGRRVAVKVLKPELAAALDRARFLREIAIVARLTHPHILPLYDSGEAGGVLYYVMPYVAGESLRARLQREGALAVRDAVRIAREVADALGCAHGHGLVHRDIKPENILLEQDHAVVADFGIAHVGAGVLDTALTTTGMVIGTPAYMSPEQAAGGDGLDGRSDLYGLGCVLYEMLEGTLPFSGATPMALLRARFTDAPRRLGATHGRASEALQAVLDLALACAPADRFATAADMIRALEEVEHTASRPPSTIAAVPAQTASIAVLPFANLSPEPDNAYFADGMTEEIINALARVRDLHVAARTSCFTFKDQAVDVAEVGRKLGVGTVLEGSVRRAGNRLRITAQLVNAADGFHLWSERYDRELTDVFDVQDEIARAIAGRLEADLAGGDDRLVAPKTTSLEAYDLYLQGRVFWAQRGPALFQALQCFQHAAALDPAFALAHAGIADTFALLAFYGVVRPNEAMPRARAAAARALELNGRLAEAHAALAWVHWTFDRDWPAAEAGFETAIALDPRCVAAHQWFASFLALARARFDDAVAAARRAVELDPLAPSPRTNLAGVLINARRFDEAIAATERALHLNGQFFLALRMQAHALAELGRMDQALGVVRRALDISNRMPWLLMDVCCFCAETGQLEQARLFHDELRLRAATQYVQPAVIAGAAWAMGRRDEAMAWLERALDENDTVLVVLKHWPAMERWGFNADPRYQELLRRIGF